MELCIISLSLVLLYANMISHVGIELEEFINEIACDRQWPSIDSVSSQDGRSPRELTVSSKASTENESIIG